jgi:hypothetical protein
MQCIGQNLREFFRTSVAQMVPVVIIPYAKPGVGGEVKHPYLRILVPNPNESVYEIEKHVALWRKDQPI